MVTPNAIPIANMPIISSTIERDTSKKKVQNLKNNKDYNDLWLCYLSVHLLHYNTRNNSKLIES